MPKLKIQKSNFTQTQLDVIKARREGRTLTVTERSILRNARNRVKKAHQILVEVQQKDMQDILGLDCECGCGE